MKFWKKNPQKSEVTKYLIVGLLSNIVVRFLTSTCRLLYRLYKVNVVVTGTDKYPKGAVTGTFVRK